VIPEACESHQLNLYIHNPFTVDDYSLGVFKSMHTLMEVYLYLLTDQRIACNNQQTNLSFLNNVSNLSR
jgi:hypothetical protein